MKELEGQGHTTEQANSIALGNGLPTSSSSGSIRSLSGPALGHSHHPSLSHRDSASSLNSLSSINTDTATLSSSATDVSPTDTRSGPISPAALSKQPANSTSPSKARNFEFNYNQSPGWANSAEFSPKTSSVGPASSAYAWQSLQPNMLDTPAEEKEDIFLPLASDAGSPFAMNFPNHRDSTSSDNSTASPTLSKSSREHSRRHSRIHSRNLSVFFPRPGENGPAFGNLPQTPEDETLTDIPSASVQGWAGGSRGSMGSLASRQGAQGMNGIPSPELEAKKAAMNRRGHHHRHSLSHK